MAKFGSAVIMADPDGALNMALSSVLLAACYVAEPENWAAYAEYLTATMPPPPEIVPGTRLKSWRDLTPRSLRAAIALINQLLDDGPDWSGDNGD